MARQGEVARQWFIPGEGIDRHVISTDIQRYLGNDATVRPGVGTESNQGVQGYWIKAYRNLTSAMIADLRADSQRWRQEQRQTGSTETYEDSHTYATGNAARMDQRGHGNAPPVDDYPPQQRPGAQSRQPVDPMQMDPPGGRLPQNPGQYGQGYYQPDARGGQYPVDPRGFPPPGRGQGYVPDQDVYGQPDNYGRFVVNPYGQDRSGQGYRAPPPPQGYTQEGQYYVPMTSGYGQPGMMATSGAEAAYYGRQQQPPPPRGQDPNPRGAGGPGYGQQDYNPNPYPSPAQTVTGPDPNIRGGPPPSGYGQPQVQYDSYGRPISNPAYAYPQDQAYPPQARDPNYGRQQPPPAARDPDRERRHRRNG